MPSYTFTKGYSAVSRIYFLFSELRREEMPDTETNISSINRVLSALSDAGSQLAVEGVRGIDSCRIALADLQILIGQLGSVVSPEQTTALTDALALFAEPADVLKATGQFRSTKYLHEGFASYLEPRLSSQLVSEEASLLP
ncbi:MAG: hypothetical protein P4L53_23235 [Candidatus Obscuribacterales bacterium]|nr:hypothetical protein [Candidatus Obscuribacterales bacterium]